MPAELLASNSELHTSPHDPDEQLKSGVAAIRGERFYVSIRTQTSYRCRLVGLLQIHQNYLHSGISGHFTITVF